MTHIVIFTKLTANPGRRDELLVALEELRSATLQEPGAEMFVVHAARDDPDAVLGYEVFTDDVALAAHRASAHVAAVGPKLGELLASPPEITYAY